jgi:hypothetical protein
VNILFYFSATSKPVVNKIVYFSLWFRLLIINCSNSIPLYNSHRTSFRAAKWRVWTFPQWISRFTSKANMRRNQTCRVELPITDHYPITEHLFWIFVICASFHFGWFKMLWERALSQALEIIFEVQRKTSIEKTAQKKKKKGFQLTKCISFFFFLLFGLLLFSKLLTFSSIVHFKRFKSAIGAPHSVLQIILEL